MAGLFYMQNVKLHCGGGWEEACLDSFKSSERLGGREIKDIGHSNQKEMVCIHLFDDF